MKTRTTQMGTDMSDGMGIIREGGDVVRDFV